MITGRLVVALLSTTMAGFVLAGGAGALGPNDHEPVRHTDLLLLNGTVITQDDHDPRAQAVAITGDEISYVGSNETARALAGRETRVIDLQGKTLLPGLIDSHIHPALGAFFHHLCQVGGFSLEENYATLTRCAETAPPGGWVVAYGWYFTDNPKLGDVTLAALDRLVPNRNLVIIARDFHIVWVNSQTLRTLSITQDTPDPVGGSYGRDLVTHQLTGALHDAAGLAVIDRVQHDSTYAASTLELFRTTLPRLNSLGITSILDALADEDLENAYRTLDAEGKLSMRVSMAFKVTAANYRTEIPKIAAKRAKNSDRIRVDFIKVFADGNVEDNLANILGKDGKPGPATHGYFTQTQMNEVVRLAEQNHLNAFVHVIGDGAARQVLDAVADARKLSPCPTCRHTLTHLEWVSPSDFPRFATLNVIANIQEGWLAPRAFGGPPGYDYAKDTASGPLGPEIAARMLPYRPLHDAGARLSAGSDWFYTDENPWDDIETGATSRDPGVSSTPPMLPDHTLSVETLLRARTLGAAYQMYDETLIGSITVGKKADMVVVDRDPLKVPAETLHDTQVIMTFSGGRLVYERGGSSVANPR